MPADHELVANPTTVKVAGWILDTHVAPCLSQLTKAANPPELSDQSDTYGSWILNQVFRAQLKNQPLRILLSVFMSRIWSARAAYSTGRSHLVSYVELLDKTNVPTSTVRAAIREFENCMVHTHLSIVAMREMAPMLGAPPPFTNNDGSDYDRVRIVCNRIKHFDEDITAGKHLHVTPLWLSDSGVATSEATVSYPELAHMLDTHAVDAKNFSEDFFDEVEMRKASKAKGDGSA